MQIELSKEKLDSLYTKARGRLLACVNDKENEFFLEEICVPWESVVVIDREVKITFMETTNETYTVEVCLQLYAAGELIGAYTWYDDEQGNPKDDSLVLY